MDHQTSASEEERIMVVQKENVTSTYKTEEEEGSDVESGEDHVVDRHRRQEQESSSPKIHRVSFRESTSFHKDESPDTLETLEETSADDDTSSSRISSTTEKDTPSSSRSRSTKKIGGKYSQDEFIFVLCAGILLSFNSGYVNGSCLSGFLMIDESMVKQSVAGFTGVYTASALALADGNTDSFGFQVSMILSFITGSCISGFLTPKPTPYRLEPSYGPTFFIGAIFLTTASLLVMACDDDHRDCKDERCFFYFAAAANGIQNGISSMYSANLIRSTHLTGTSTDIGLYVGQLLRGETKHVWKLLVLICLAASFWLGGLISFWATKYFHQFSLLFNAGLYILIGIGFVCFLVHEHHISITAAMTGRWMWQQVLDKLEPTLRSSANSNNLQGPQQGTNLSRQELFKAEHFGTLFDSLDGVDENDELNVNDLFTALNNSGIKLSKQDVKVLMKHADSDGNGKLSRAEWIDVARSATRSSTFALTPEAMNNEDY